MRGHDDMKQFGTVFGFELKGHLKSKSFIIITIVLVLIIATVLSIPRIKTLFDDDGDIITDNQNTDELPVMILGGDSTIVNAAKESFTANFGGDYKISVSDESEDVIRQKINSEDAECAFILSDNGSYKYLVNTLEIFDMNTDTADSLLSSIYQASAMLSSGMTEDQVKSVLEIQISHETEVIGNDQTNSFFYTYIMIFALYMVILLYGQMISTSVASEKSSRAMELLITSVKPVSMLFGKVLAACVTGLIQLTAIFGSSLLFFRLNDKYIDKNGIIANIFNIPTDIFIYLIVFFILGFALYAFMLGAVGSTVSKLEELNTASTPVMLLFIAGFIVVIISMTGTGMDNMLIKICSFIPFTSPMAMFSRIAMSVVPAYEIAASIIILVASVLGIGVLSAKIYRTGVMMYGTKPKLSNIIKLNFQNKK